MIIKFQSLIYQQQPYIRLLAIFLFWIGILHNQNAVAATETVPVGSFIVNMGVVPQTVANGLKPYGMLHQLLREQNVPIKWVINPTKSKDGVDFTYNGTAFKGGPFIIYANYRTPAVNAIIASWQAQGVVGVTTTSPVDVPVYNTINYYMNWTLNSTNSSIAQAFLQNAGIPSSNWNFVAPSELTCCNDIFVMPHADPTWATHQRLLSWNDECDGAIWAGCHAVSVLENIINPSNPAQTMNFLMSNGATPGQAAVLFGDHDDGSPPYQYGHSAQPVMQFMGTIDAATQNGSEQIYLPQVSWRPTTMVGVWDDSQADVPSVSPGVAAVLAFGQGLGDDNRGRVMYEGGHNIGGTSAASVAAQRAFFNFSFWASQSKAINVAINVPSSMSVGTAYTVSATATGGAGAPYIYEWISTCGGTFANPTAATTTFTPNASSTGCIISCKVRDNCGSRVGFGSQSVSSPQPPVANNDNATIGTQCGQGGSTTINILSNDSDGDTPLGDLTITLSGNGANGTFVLNPNGTVTYTANVNFSGTDQVQYQICDPTGFCDNALISVTVGAADINGCLPNQTYAIASSGAADSLHTTTSVTGTLTDVLDQPDGLTVEMDNNGDVLILGFPETINAGDTLTLYLKRGDNTNPTTLTIESSLNGTSGFSTPTTIGITTTGVLPYIYIVPSGGLNFVRLKRTAGKPNIDAITYEIWDCVNAAPTLGNDQGLALEDFPVQIQVLGNDQDPLGQALSISRIITQPTNGLVSLNPNGTIDYQPNNDYSGTDSFVYEACNTSGLCSQATVNIQITDDGCPAGQTRPSTGTEVSTTLTIADDSYIQKDKATTNYGNVNKFVVGEKDNNIRRSLIRFDLSTIPSGAIITSAQLKLNRITGTKAQVIDVHALTESWTESLVTWNKKDAANWTTAGGSYNPTAAASVNMGTTTGFKYWGITSLVQSWVNTPANNFGVLLKRQAETNKDKHEFASSENTTVANRPALVVTYLQLAPCEAIGNRPPLAQPDFATTNSVTPTTITVKANDTDPDNNTLTVTSLISPPSSGTAVLTGSQTFTYTPTSGFNGKTSFTYRICDDGSPIKCDTAKVTITVTNAPPTAVNDNGLTLNANSDITVNVQGNDSDPEGQALTTTIVTQPLNGSAVLVGNSIKYTPNPGFSGADVLTYSICEPASGGCNATTLCSTALVNLTVNNQPPIANNDTKNVNACQPTYIDVLVNDSDPENGPLTVSVLTQPVHGTATVVGAQILYTPTPGYAGPTDGFTYQICDDASPSLCTPATVSITFNTTPVNNTPVATDDIDHTVANVTAFVQVLSNDNDPDGDELAVTVGGSLLAPTNGTVSVLPNKQIAYVPASGFTGTDVFEYQICDVHDNNALCVPIPSLCDIAQVTITVENQPPVAVDDQAFTGINIPVFIPVLPNDFDPEGNTISVTSGGTNGTNLQTTQGGTITISGNGFNYTPPTGYTGTDVFQYVICDNGNPSECATAQVTIYITPPIDLEVTKTVSPANATAGSNVVFTITVNNTSTTNATGVVVKDLLPSSYTYVSDNGAGFYNSATGIWFIGNLNASATRTLNITATVVDYANANVAEVSDADQYDIDSSPNNYNGLPNEDDEGTAKVNCVALSITPTPNNPNCVASNGYITLSISNGVSPFSFEWTSGTNSGIGTGTTVGGLGAGDYSITVTDNLGCIGTTTATLSLPAGPSSTSSTTAVKCFGGSDGGVDLSPTGGTPGYTYLWSNNATTQDLSNVSSGTYSVTITDANNCQTTVSATVSQPTTALGASSSTTAVSCFGGSNGGVDLSPSGGTPGYTYLWSNNATTQDLSNVSSDTYSVTITDSNNCQTTVSATVSQPTTALGASSSTTAVKCFGGSDGGVDLSPTGGTPGYTYLWSNNATTQDLSNVATGTYSVTITDANNCQTTVSATVSQPALALDASSSTTAVKCFGGSDGGVDLSPTGGTPGYTYLWGNGITTQDLSNVATGTYSVTITDANNCQTTVSATVSQPTTALGASSSTTAVKCFGGSDGGVDLSPTGGTPGYTYLWGNNATTQDLSNVSSDTYSVTITDANNCQTTVSATVSQPALALDASSSTTAVKCFGGSDGGVDLSPTGGTPGYTYLWSNNATTQDLSNVATGTYSVTITDANNCQTTVSATVSQPTTALGASSSTTAVSCFGGSDGGVDLSPTGGTPGYTYLWSNNATTQDLSNVATGTYSVTITDANNCQTTVSATVSQPALALDASSSTTAVKCFGGSDGGVDLSPTGGTPGYTYLWSNNATTQDLSNVSSGTYSVTITDANNCQTTVSASVSQPASALDASSSTTAVSCFGGSNGGVDLSPSGGTPGYTYLWSNNATTQDLSNVSSDTYSVTITDANGCTKTASAFVSQPTTALGASSSTTAVKCFGGSDGGVDLSPTGGTPGYTYLWSNNATTQDLSNVATGTYSVTITDANNCQTTVSATVSQPTTALGASSSTTAVKCFGGSDGGVDLSPTGGTPGYTYLWSNGITTQDLSNVATGTYSVTITDANNCQTTVSATVSQPALALDASSSTTAVKCFGGSDGGVDLSPTGGTPGYTYLWGNGITTQDLSNVATGTYSVTITDANNCQTTVSATVSQPTTALGASSSTTAVKCFGGSDGGVDLSPTGGTPGYTYLWSNNATTQDLSNVATGTYSVTITDANNCQTTVSATVSQPTTALGASSSTTAVKCFGGSDGGVDLSPTGGTPGYTYLWSNNATTQDLSNVATGTYSVTITDANNCQTTVSATVSQPALALTVICTTTPNTASVTASGGTSPYDYLWSNGSTNSSISGLTGANYSVTVTDFNGCTAICGSYVPNFNPDFGATQVNVPLTGDVSTNDNQTPGSTYGNPPVNPSNPSGCAPIVASNGTYSFVCDTPGEYTFLVPVCEPSPSTVCTDVPLIITVIDPTIVTNAPIANPDYNTTLQDNPVTSVVLSNDQCQNGPTCTLSNPTIVTGPSVIGATAVVNPDGTITYNPAPGFVGVDSVLYSICDNQAPPKCDEEWLYITVLPIGSPNSTNAMDDYAQTPFNTAVSGNVSTNDTDPEGDNQTVVAQTTTVPGSGTLVLNTDGSYTFTPVNGFSGPVDFPYTTCDDGTPVDCSDATLHVLVDPQAPDFNPDFGATQVNVPLTGDVSTNDNQTPGSTYGNPPVNPSNPSGCAPIVASNGTYSFVCDTPGEYTFLVPVCEPSPSTVCTDVPLIITVIDPTIVTNAPIANPDYNTTLQDNPVTSVVLSNDQCQNGPTCTLSNPTIVTGPSVIGATAVVNPDGTITYNPAPGFVGVDSVLYSICDNQAPPKCDEEWLYITVLPIGSPNSTNAMDDYAQTPFNTAVSGNVSTNDTDPEGDNQTVVAQTTTVPGSGTLVLNTDGSYTFTPVNGFSGPVDFPYTTCDDGTPVDCSDATLHVLVDPQAPDFNPDFGATQVNVPLTGDVSTNDNQTPGSTYGNPPVNPSNPSGCAPIVASNGTYSFVCDTPGEYTFLVPVCEPSPSTVCTDVPLIITVIDPTIVTNAPIANPDYNTTLQDNPVTSVVLSNDQCQNGPTCTLSNPTIVTGPSVIGATAVVNPDGTITYNPAPGFVGVDSVLYSICDNQAPPKCDEEWLYITVLPIGSPNSTNAMDDYAQTPFNTAVSGNVSTNDTDPEGDNQTVVAQTTTVPGSGTLVLNTDGSYTFTPVNGFSGPVDFPYTTCDDGTPVDCSDATLHVLVDPQAPDFNPDFGATQVNVPLTGDVSTNDNQTPGSTYGNPPVNPSNPSGCAPIVASNGTYSFVCDTPGEYTFLVPVCEPSPSTVCTDVPLIITVIDPTIVTNAPIANPDYNTTLQDNPVTSVVLSNDQCQNGPTCTLSNPTIVTGPSVIGATAVVNPDGTITYNPAPGFVGVDSVLYSICDNQAPPKCDEEWLYITVLPIGSPNSTNAMDDYAQTPFNTAVSGNVSTNDTDPEGDNQTVVAQTTTVPGSGTLVLNTDGSYTFTPVNGFSGPVDFPYTTCDDGTPVDCSDATLHVLVDPQAPNFNPDFGTTQVNVPLTGDVSTNDNQTPGSTYGNPPVNPSNPSGCAPIVASDGTYSFVCDTPGEYTFLVPVCEPSPSTVCTDVPLIITVIDPTIVTNAPIANPDYNTTLQDNPVTSVVLSNDQCQNGPTCTLSNPTIVTGPSVIGATAVVNPDGTITYNPAPGFVGVDSVLYSICDNQAPPKCDEEWLYITVLPIGSPNSTNAMDDYAQTPFNTAVSGNVSTNDTDPEGDNQTVVAQTTTVPGSGTLVLNTDGSYTFTPVNGFSGPVDFPYTTCDDGTPVDCSDATLHVLVDPQAPNFNPDFGATQVNVPLTGDVSTNDNQTPGSTYGNPPVNPSNPSGCAPIVASNGTYSFVCDTPGEYTFLVPVCEPSPSTVCTDVPLIITVIDPTIVTNAPIANPDYNTTLQDNPVTSVVLSNDQCQNGPTCTLSNPTIVTGPSVIGATAVVNPDGTITYNPAPGFVGVDSVLYSICDNQAPPKCDEEWLYITVLPIGSPNSTNAMDDYAQTPFNTAVSGNVSTNDTDPEGDNQTVVAQTTTVPGSGTLVLNTDGSYTFTPVNGFSGPVDFPYTTCDDGTPVDCSDATLHVLVDPPCTLAASATVNNATCNGGNGSVTISATGAVGASSGTGTFNETAGTYTYTVTDAKGCSATASATVSEPAALNFSTVPNCIGANGTLTVNATGGSGSYLYSFNGGNFTTNNVSPSYADGTTVTVTIRDVADQSCVYTDDITVQCTCPTYNPIVVATVNGIVVPIADIFNTGVCSGSDVVFTITNLGGTVLSYSWVINNVEVSTTNTLTLNSQTIDVTGSITITYTNGCVISNPVNIKINASPGGNVTASCTGSNSTINITGALADYNVTVTNAANTTVGTIDLALNGGVYVGSLSTGLLPNTNYTVTLVDAVTGCQTAYNVTTLTACCPGNPTLANNGPICEDSPITLTATLPVGATATSYAWSGPAGSATTTNGSVTIPNMTPAKAGVYNVTVTYSNGCTGTASTNVAVNPKPTITAITPSCVGGAGRITVVATNAVTYGIPGTTNSTGIFNGLSAGTYTVTVTSAAGCTKTATVTVAVCGCPTPVASNNGPICAGSALSLSVNPNLPTGVTATYVWSGPAGSSTQQNPIIPNMTPAKAGVYNVTVTYSNGCTGTASTNVAVNPKPTITAITPSCVGGAGRITVVATNAVTYGIPGTTNSTGIFNGLSAGTYTVTVTSAAGCTKTATVTVAVCGCPTPVASNNGPICAGSALSLSVNPNLPTGVTATYVWSGPAGSSTQQNPIIPNMTPAKAGVYNVTVTYSNGCTGTASTNVAVNPKPTITAITPSCVGGAGRITVVATNAVTYGIPGTTNSTGIFNGLSAGTYTVTVTSAAGCTKTATVTVAVCGCPTPVASNNGPICAGSALSLSVNPNLPTGVTATYVWSGPAGSSTQQNPIIPNMTPAKAGVYNVTVTYSNGCTGTASTNVALSPAPVVVTISGPASFCAGSSATLTTSGGAYAWSNGGNSASINVTTAGTYTVTVTSAAGCTKTATKSVTVTALPAISANVICGTNGATVTISGSATSYTLNGVTQSSNIFTGVANGTYTVSATNAAACVGTTNVTVNCNTCAAEVGDITVSSVVCPGDPFVVTPNFNSPAIGYANYVLVVNAAGVIVEVAPATSGVTQTLSTSTAGTYNVYAYSVQAGGTVPSVGTNVSAISGNCFDLSNPPKQAILPESPLALVGYQNSDEGNEGGITPFHYNTDTVLIVGGLQPYNFDWEIIGYVRYDITYTETGTEVIIYYSDDAQWNAIVTDSYGCANDSLYFTNMQGSTGNTILDIDAYEVTPSSDYTAPDGSINLTVTGGNTSCGTYSYEWSGPDTWTPSFPTTGTAPAIGGNQYVLTGLPMGWYSVTVTDCIGNVTEGWYWVPASARGRTKAVETLSVMPNPFADKAIVEFTVNVSGNTTVNVYSIDGKQVATLYNATTQAGETYQVTLDGANLPSGMYFVKMTNANGETMLQKAMISR